MIDNTFIILSGWEIYKFTDYLSKSKKSSIFAQHKYRNITINRYETLSMYTEDFRNLGYGLEFVDQDKIPDWLVKRILEIHELQSHYFGDKNG